MESGHGPTTQGGIPGVAQSMVGRILNKDENENVRIDTLAKIAKAYGLEPWMMLVPGMDPKNPPALQPVSKIEKELHERLQAAFAELAKLKAT